MFKFDEICELVRLVGDTKVARLEIEHGGTTIRLEGPPPPQMVAASAQPAAPVQVSEPAPASTPASPATGDGGTDDDLHVVTSPIVGTFYRAPNPDAEPYVKVGDVVSAGQVLCIVEAMKLMNEIECDVEGTVVKVFPDDAEPVEYGGQLFAIRPA